jgi:flagellar hook-basal body complex protein FliE
VSLSDVMADSQKGEVVQMGVQVRNRLRVPADVMAMQV